MVQRDNPARNRAGRTRCSMGRGCACNQLHCRRHSPPSPHTVSNDDAARLERKQQQRKLTALRRPGICRARPSPHDQCRQIMTSAAASAAAQHRSPLGGHPEGAVHTHTHTAAHGDAVDQRHVWLAQAGDQVVEAVLLKEEPVNGWEVVGTCRVHQTGHAPGYAASAHGHVRASLPSSEANLCEQSLCGWLAPVYSPQRLLNAPRLPQLHNRLHIAAGTKGAVSSALQQAARARRCGRLAEPPAARHSCRH